jgi:hypothetical protein
VEAVLSRLVLFDVLQGFAAVEVLPNPELQLPRAEPKPFSRRNTPASVGLVGNVLAGVRRVAAALAAGYRVARRLSGRRHGLG